MTRPCPDCSARPGFVWRELVEVMCTNCIGLGIVGERFLKDRVALFAGDCLDVLERMEPDSVDSVVVDPPYHLTSIVKRFGSDDAAPAQVGKTGAYARASAGFMGKRWDGGDVAFRLETWVKVLRVLKPGGHLVAFSGTRTYHLMATAIDEAGFEIRDQLAWAYGSGFPKSHDISKAIDRAAGAQREKVRVEASSVRNPKAIGAGRDGMEGATRPWIQAALANGFHEKDGDEPATDAAREWQGWGTALKPAWEPICLARKPLSEPTIAANVLRWGTGALNIDATRIGFVSDEDKAAAAASQRAGQDQNANRKAYGRFENGPSSIAPYIANMDKGRWPANVVHDGSPEVLAAFPETQARANKGLSERAPARAEHVYSGGWSGADCGEKFNYDGPGSAARFFYTAKADADDRLASKHPTVKPVDLIQWLVRLVTPPRGLVLDCFAGTGTTGEAAYREGMRAVLIEREADYLDDIRRRMGLVLAGPDERSRSIAKLQKPVPIGPLFDGIE